MKIYTNQENILRYFVSKTNDIYTSLGFDSASEPSTLLATAITAFLTLKLLLDNMVSTAVFILALLAILLIYSLMISDVEEKTYEFGMLRALGLRKISLVSLLLLQGLTFALPGLFMGLLLAYAINAAIAYVFFSGALLVSSYEMASSAMIIGFALGIFIPVFSNYIPIQRALSKTLKDSLDIYHRVVTETTIIVMRLESIGLSPYMFLIAVELIFIGVLCYYMVPQAFLSSNIGLFLAILNIILMLMILGLTLLGKCVFNF